MKVFRFQTFPASACVLIGRCSMNLGVLHILDVCFELKVNEWNDYCLKSVVSVKLCCWDNAAVVSMGDRSASQAGQFSTQTLLIWSHVVVIHAECGLAHLGEISRAFSRFWSNICCRPDDVFFRKGLFYFSKTMPNHILRVLQQNGSVKRSGC